MRVALVSRAVFPFHGYGGLERHVAALEKYLRRAGVDVTLYTSPSSHGTATSCVEVPYRVVPWPKRKGFVVLDRDTNYLAWSLRAGRRVLKDGRAAAIDADIDIVQADGGGGFGYALLAGPGDPPLVLHPHGMEEFKASPWKRALYLPLRAAIRHAAAKAARVLAPDAAMKDEVRRTLDVPEEKIAVVPNAIDLEEVDRDVPTVDLGRLGGLGGLGLPRDARVFLSVGRLETNKGFPVLVRALGELRDRLPPGVVWVLVGDGPEKGTIRRLIEREGLESHVRLAGRLNDDELHALYERAELFLHPTLYEGSSMVTLEAMAHAKPVVATRVGGIPDKVVHGQSGLLVPPGDPDALAAAILEAITVPERLAAWGAEGRRLVETRFSWSRRIDEVMRLYEHLTGKRA